MRRNFLAYFLFGYAILAWFHACVSHAASSAGLLTAREQGLLLQGAGMAGQQVAPSQNHFLSDLEKTIRRANPGKDSQSLRRPVSEAALRKLQIRSALRGNFIFQQELRATTDYAHALLRESPGQSLVEKVKKLPMQERKPFHGNGAEVAEARSRGIVLTKSRTSTMWDLTETKFPARNFQMKIYEQPDKSLSSLLHDLDKNLDFKKHGILTKDTLEREVKAGRLVREGNSYRPVGRSDVELHPSKVFSRPADSHLYAKTGRGSLIKRGLPGGKAAPTGFQNAGKWLGRGSWVGLFAIEGYIIKGYATGRLSEREFVTAQSAIVGGGLGGWAGMQIGAWIGLAIAGGPEDPFAVITVPAGALIGGLVGVFRGAKLGEMAASGFYGRLDEEQQRQVEAFICKEYGVTR